MVMLVRIKPFDPKKGRLVRRYTAFSTRFEEKLGWYRVSEDIARYLATVHQVAGDESSPPVFDVCTEDQARAIDEAEHRLPAERAQSTAPNLAHADSTALTTGDLPGSRPVRTDARASRRG